MVVKGYQNINDNILSDVETIQDYASLATLNTNISELPPLNFSTFAFPSLGDSVFPTMDSLLLGSLELSQNIPDFGVPLTSETPNLLGNSVFPTMDELLLGTLEVSQNVQDFGLSLTGDTPSILGDSVFPTMDELLLGTLELSQNVQDFGLSVTGDTPSVLGDSVFPTMDDILLGSFEISQNVQDFALSLGDVFAEEPSENYYSGNEDYTGDTYNTNEYYQDEEYYYQDGYSYDDDDDDYFVDDEDGDRDSSGTGPQHQNGTSVAELQAQIDEAVANGETEIVLDETVYIGPGEVLDGKGLTFVASESLGDGGQSEGQKPMFEVNGGTIKNMHLTGENGNGAADGIHAYGDEVTIDNVHFDNVGEDAITAKDVDKLNILNSSFTGASDKVIQVNCAADIIIDNVKSYGHESDSKFLRINGGHTYPGGTVLITNSDLDNPEAIVGIDDSGQGYTITFGEGNNFNGNLETKVY